MFIVSYSTFGSSTGFLAFFSAAFLAAFAGLALLEGPLLFIDGKSEPIPPESPEDFFLG